MDVSKVGSGSSYASQSDFSLKSNNIEVKNNEESRVLQQRTLYSQAGTHGDQLVKQAKIESMVEGLNDFLEPVNTSIKFVLHDKLDRRSEEHTSELQSR